MTSKPAYDLDLIKKIALSGNVIMDRRAEQNSRSLEYFTDEVANCVCCIESTGFLKTLVYPPEVPGGRNLTYDVYKSRCRNSEGIEDLIYLKLRVSAGNWLFIGSFKQDGSNA